MKHECIFLNNRNQKFNGRNNQAFFLYDNESVYKSSEQTFDESPIRIKDEGRASDGARKRHSREEDALGFLQSSRF
jgi:hypothetical protein